MKPSKHASHEKVSMHLVVHVGGGQVFIRRPESGGSNCESGLEVGGEGGGKASEDDSKVETSFQD